MTPGVEADTHDFIMTGAEDSKFGFGRNQGLAMQAVKRAIELPGIDFDGLHMHIGSQIFALHSFAKAIEVIVEFIAEIKAETGVEVRMLDTGGGLGIAYGLPDEPSTVKDYGKVVVDGIKEECEKHGLTVPAMAVEPGRSIVANAGVTLYTVGSIKEIPNIRTYVAVDGGMSDNIRTSLYDAHYEALHRQQGRPAARDGRDGRRQALRERRHRGQRRAAAVPGGRRHPVRVRDRRLLPVDEQQLQQAGASRRGLRRRRASGAGWSAERPTTT